MSDFTIPKKRGAPRGNQNAFRHGGYARYLPPTSVTYSTSLRSRITLEEEIAYLRSYFRTTALAGTSQDDPMQSAFILRTLSVAAVAISRLIQSETTLAILYGDCIMTDRLPEVTQVILKSRADADTAPPLAPDPQPCPAPAPASSGPPPLPLLYSEFSPSLPGFNNHNKRLFRKHKRKQTAASAEPAPSPGEPPTAPDSVDSLPPLTRPRRIILRSRPFVRSRVRCQPPPFRCQPLAPRPRQPLPSVARPHLCAYHRPSSRLPPVLRRP